MCDASSLFLRSNTLCAQPSAYVDPTKHRLLYKNIMLDWRLAGASFGPAEHCPHLACNDMACIGMPPSNHKQMH